MNDSVVCKMIGVRFPFYLEAKEGRRQESEVINVSVKERIKDAISELMMGGHDNVLVNYNNKYYLCNNRGDGNFDRREIGYHPLVSKVS